MATYLELAALRTDPDLLKKVQVATAVAADAIINEDPLTTNHDNRVKWAARALAYPVQEGGRMLNAVLAANKGFTTAQITGASDAAIQSNVDAAVDVVATGSV